LWAAGRCALHTLRKFPQGTRFGGQLANPALSGRRLTRQARLRGSALRQQVYDGATFLVKRRLCICEHAGFSRDRGLVIAGESERLGAAVFFGLVSGRERAGDDAGAGRARLNPALGESSGDDGGFKGAAGARAGAGLGVDLILNAGEALARGLGGGNRFFATARGLDQARIECADVALGGVGLIAQPFGALRLGAAIAVGLRSRALGLGVSRPYEERERCHKRGQHPGAFCASCHFTTTISSGIFSPGDTE
jgi:hypothetical protein